MLARPLSLHRSCVSVGVWVATRVQVGEGAALTRVDCNFQGRLLSTNSSLSITGVTITRAAASLTYNNVNPTLGSFVCVPCLVCWTLGAVGLWG